MSAPYPGREEARRLVQDAEKSNPGAWARHSEWAAHCAERIAAAAGMDAEKAYVLGLLHDIGRKFGRGHLAHVYDGYHYMMDLGYTAAARICLTHSFSFPTLDAYIGNRDISGEKQAQLQSLLTGLEFDDYDRLIQLCDCMAKPEGVVPMEERMADVKRRYGSYPQEKWVANMALKTYFDQKAGKDIYELVK